MRQPALKFTSWPDAGMWIGHLDDYPGYMTQGQTEAELRENVLDIYRERTGGEIPAVRTHDWYHNPTTKQSQPVPRHREINEHLAKHGIKTSA